MTKFSVILFIIKQRLSNIVLLSIMFSSLLVIFMVGIGVKNVFYDYLRSDYGNVPDLKIKLNNISDTKLQNLIQEIQSHYDINSIDFLSGYETVEKVSIVDSEDLLLTNGLPLLIKGINFSKNINLNIDGQKRSLKVNKISYQDELYVELNLGDIEVKDIDSIEFLSKNTPIPYEFCKKISMVDKILRVEAIPCKDKVDDLFKAINNGKSKDIKIEIDGKVMQTKIIDADDYYKSLVVEVKNISKIDRISLAYGAIECDFGMIDNFELSDEELIINFKQDTTMVKKYKLFLSKILKDYINYQRMILKLKLHSFESDDADDKQDPQMVFLNELTDLIDLIFAKDMGNLAISSTFLAEDLNNFGILDNFTVQTQNSEFGINIRSTIAYNPEKLYDKNILIINRDVLTQNFNIKDKNNFIDIYNDTIHNQSDLEQLKSIVAKYDPNYHIILQEDIIPSIKPKKLLFDSSVMVVAIFILAILFIAMYIVLLQFYSNFNSELSLLKLYGSKIHYQAFINFCAFIISSGINYIFMIQEEQVLNKIMMKYFFTSYKISINDLFVSIFILFVYIVILYIIENRQIKKLNLIKGQ